MALSVENFPPQIKHIYDEKLTNQLANTHASISSLNQVALLLQNPNLLMRPILAKESESSSKLEGTQASLDDAYKEGIDIFSQKEEIRDDAREILSYERAMLSGLNSLHASPLNSHFIRSVNKVLLTNSRGENKHPGEYRKIEVHIGPEGSSREDARYIPPSPLHIESLMENLVNFLNSSTTIHPLIACALMHHRFEAIHPFEDGNGRTGRLLISLFLIKKGVLTYPILYPSGYFEKYKDEYMNCLSRVDKEDDWYQWIIFFLNALEEQAKVALKVGLDINDTFKESRVKIEHETAGLNLIRVLEYSFTQPYITVSKLHEETQIPQSSCERYLTKLVQKEILVDIGIINKRRVYVNLNLLKILRKI